MTTVLVTGAAGFIGRAMCAEFVKSGWQVRAAVRRASASIAGTEEVVGELAPEPTWPLNGAQVVVHLAGVAHEIHGQNAEAVYQEINCAATERLARAAARAGVRRFVFMSSIKVNGERTAIDRPFRAHDAPQPQDRYARSKWDAERALGRVSAETGLEMVILRPPLVYGPGVRANFLRLIRLVERGMPLPLGAIHNRRSMIYVGNLAQLAVRAASSSAVPGETLLVADGSDFSTPQLIAEIARALGRPARLVPLPVALLRALGAVSGRSAEIGRLVDSLVVDAAATRARLGWQPAHSSAEGIAATVRGYRAAASAR